MVNLKNYKFPIIVVSSLLALIIVLIIFFSVMARANAVEFNAITFQAKYTDAENKIENIVATSAVREGYKTDLLQYTDKVKQDYDMSLEDKNAFLTFVRKIDAENLKSKMRVLSYYGKVKTQFDTDVANNYFTMEVKSSIDSLFNEYSTAFNNEKYQEAYNKLSEISGKLSVRVTEDGVEEEEVVETIETPAEETQTTENTTANTSTEVSSGKGYHPEAKTGDVVVDPNNGNTGVVAPNGIEVYTLPNETTYSYITIDEFVAMMVRSGTPEAMARRWAQEMANEKGLITIGVDDDGSYE